MDKYEISGELAKKIQELKIGNVPDDIGIDGKIEILIYAYELFKLTLEKNENNKTMSHMFTGNAEVIE